MASPLKAKYGEAYPEAITTSSSSASATPHFRATTSPSQKPSSMKEISVLPTSLTTEAWPTSPQWMALLPMAIITGISSSWISRRPPVMKRSVPFSAPIFEPVMGASSMSAPRRAAPPPPGAPAPGPMVEAST